MTIKEIKRQIKGVFKLPKRKWYFGRVKHGAPHFYPINWCRTIVKYRRLIRKTPQELADYLERWPYASKEYMEYKNLPMVRRSYNRVIKLLGREYYVEWGWPVAVHVGHLGYKDKYGTPRFEWSPSFHIFFFGLQLCYWWVPPVNDLDSYWEQVLWYIHYSGKDTNKARETWGWRDADGNSTWNNNYLI